MAESVAEFSRPMAIHDLPVAGRPFAIEANADERAALARLYQIRDLLRLQASGTVRPQAGGERIRLDGRLQAEVVQTCVVTLEPITSRIDAPLQRLYGAEAGEEWEEGAGAEVFLDLSCDLLTEPLDGDTLDLGAAAAEQLALELDPYPRAPGAEFGGLDDAAPTASASGLAQLAGWRKGSGETG
jgi:hypothetical protein